MRKTLSPSEEQALQKEIDRLHKKGSGDFQTLLRQVEQKRRVVQLNIPQLIASMSTAPTLILEWGRGTGKTTIYGHRMLKIITEMPRSTGLFIGPTYQAILTRIVPSLIQGLEFFGLYQNLHYFIGQKPPMKWRTGWGVAYQPPVKYDRYITFWNGTGFHLISQDVPGDGRGLNSDCILGDEAGLLNGRKLQEATDPTLRGTNTSEFKKSHLFGSKFYTSSTPLTQDGQWFVDYEQKAIKEPDKINFIPATCEHNMHNLRPGYLEDAQREAIYSWVFDAEYKNKRPKFRKDSFYLLLDSDRHCYDNFNYSYYDTVGKAQDCRGDADCIRGVPLILGVDWGAAINSLTVSQNLASIMEFRTIKVFYVLGENKEIQDDLFRDFHNYYQHHDEKLIYLWYDNTGNNRTGNTRVTRAEQAKAQLDALGWNVVLMTVGGSNPHHDLKYQLWELILKEADHRIPRYRMNRSNCRYLYLSMHNARTAQGRNGELKKDKSSEGSKNLPRQEATDLSDAEDAKVFGMFQHLLAGFDQFIPFLSIK